jgi:hypothetical protein
MPVSLQDAREAAVAISGAVLDFVVQKRGHDHVRQIIAVLEAAGFKARLHNTD